MFHIAVFPQDIWSLILKMARLPLLQSLLDLRLAQQEDQTAPHVLAEALLILTLE